MTATEFVNLVARTREAQKKYWNVYGPFSRSPQPIDEVVTARRLEKELDDALLTLQESINSDVTWYQE